MSRLLNFLRPICFCAIYLLFSVPAQAEPECRLAENAMEIASQIRGLQVLTAVPCKIRTRPEVEQYLRETIDEKIPKSRIEHEERAYKLLGLIPDSYPYMEGIVRLYSEQVGGYYDPAKNYYAMAAWLPDTMQMTIAVHELTHALQDQHFKLDALMDASKLTSDELMSRSALAEGDATIVMLDYVRALQGLGPVAELESATSLMMQNIGGAMFSSSLQTAPPALQALLLFPYVSGLNFTHDLLRHGGMRRVNEAFLNPPLSSEEILHPDIYLKRIDGRTPKGSAGTAHVNVPAPDEVFSDTLGEFVINILLSNWIDRGSAGAASAGWDADKIALYPESESGLQVQWRSFWDTSRDADEFFDALRGVMRKRFPGVPVESFGEKFSSKTPIGVFSVSKSDRAVQVEILK